MVSINSRTAARWPATSGAPPSGVCPTLKPRRCCVSGLACYHPRRHRASHSCAALLSPDFEKSAKCPSFRSHFRFDELQICGWRIFCPGVMDGNGESPFMRSGGGIGFPWYIGAQVREKIRLIWFFPSYFSACKKLLEKFPRSEPRLPRLFRQFSCTCESFAQQFTYFLNQRCSNPLFFF